MKRVPFVALLLVASLAPAPLAHSQDRQATPQNPPTFRSGVELVRMDVRVVDGEGRPVTDLKAQDLEVVEGGQVRPIVLFQHVAEPAGTYLEVARSTIGAEVSTNRGAPRGHLYIIVFDQSHITPGNEQRARRAAERFLRTRVRPGDRVGLYALAGPGPSVAFTADVRSVLSRLIEVRGFLDKESFGTLGGMTLFEAYEITRGNDAVLQRVVARANSSDPSTDLTTAIQAARAGALADATPFSLLQGVIRNNAKLVVDRGDGETRAFLAPFAEAIRNLAGFEGRKSVILISEGFFSDYVQADVERVAAAAAQAYAAIYSLDINRRGADPAQATPSGNDLSVEIQDRIEPLGSLAAETSGDLFTDANSRLDATFERIADQSLDYYIVGFEPVGTGQPAGPDRYHRVTIRAKRPGLLVRTRTGYSFRDPIFARNRRRAIDMALAAPFPQQGLPVEMTTYVSYGTAPGAHRVVVSVQVELPIASGNEPRPADVVFVAKRASDGRVVASGTDVMPLPRTTASGTTGWGRYQVQFDAPPGEYLMRVVAREPGDGITGSVDRRFEVRHFDGADVTASDLIVGRRTDALPVRAEAYSGDALTARLEVYARRPHDLEGIDVTAALLSATGEAVLRAKATLGEVSRARGSTSARVAAVEVPLGGVAAGEYTLRATLKAGNETVLDLNREVTVLPGTPPSPPPPTTRAFEPTDVLDSPVAQRLVASLREGATDAGTKNAAELAAARAWDRVASATAGSSPTTIADLALRGMGRFAQRQYAGAATDLQAALDLDPGSAVTAFLLGWAHSAAGNERGAITAWRAATVASPTLVPAYLALADAYLRQSQPALARQVLQAGLAAMPQSVELQSKLAEIERR